MIQGMQDAVKKNIIVMSFNFQVLGKVKRHHRPPLLCKTIVKYLFASQIMLDGIKSTKCFFILQLQCNKIWKREEKNAILTESFTLALEYYLNSNRIDHP